MLVLAVKIQNKIPKIPNTTILTYDELFEKYKSQCKKAYWRTTEGFYLEWLGCETIKEMKQCVFIYPGSKETYENILENYEVMDTNEIDY